MPNARAGEPDIRTISSSLVYEDGWMALRRDEIERSDGSRGSYAVVDKPDFAVVIPAAENRFCLVEEYRYPVGRRCWAFPQGAFPGRGTGDPEQLARLELAQETGLRARQLTSTPTWRPASPRARWTGSPRSRTCGMSGSPATGSGP